MVVIGFNPLVVLFAEMLVQLYQTALHTEAVRKLPRPIEVVFNTPSHHRVHHGSNKAYIDKNYGGVFIVWDRLFGTFAEENEKVVYGVVPAINTINPLRIFFSGFMALVRKTVRAPTVTVALAYWIVPPEWRSQDVMAKNQASDSA